MTTAEIAFRYFSPTPGHVVPRYGTQTLIGATRGPKGHDINPEAIVPIPSSEVDKYPREYANALRRGELKERTKAEFDAYNKARTERRRDEGEKIKAQREADAAADKPKSDKPSSKK